MPPVDAEVGATSLTPGAGVDAAVAAGANVAANDDGRLSHGGAGESGDALAVVEVRGTGDTAGSLQSILLRSTPRPFSIPNWPSAGCI